MCEEIFAYRQTRRKAEESPAGKSPLQGSEGEPEELGVEEEDNTSDKPGD
jgi:hypothetical protein